MPAWTPVTDDRAVHDGALALTHRLFLNAEIRFIMFHTHTYTQRRSVFTLLDPHQGAWTKVSRIMGTGAP